MSARVHWQHAPGEARASVEAALAEPTRAELVASSRPRTLLRVGGTPSGDVVLKRFHRRSGPHPWRDGIKSRLGLAAAQREWRALTAMAHAGVAVPEPLGLAQLEDGDALLVSRFVAGPTLHSLLERDSAGRSSELAALADAVRSLHAAGWSHGDLHPGNVIASPSGLVFIDWQRSRPSPEGGRAQLDDLGRLDHSLATLAIPSQSRARVMERALAHPGVGGSRLMAARAASHRIARRQARRRAREARAASDQPSSGNARHSPSPTRS